MTAILADHQQVMEKMVLMLAQHKLVVMEVKLV